MKSPIDRALSRVLMLINRLTVTVRDHERGASLVEYCLMVGLVTLVCVSAVGFFGEQPAVPLSSAGSILGG